MTMQRQSKEVQMYVDALNIANAKIKQLKKELPEQLRTEFIRLMTEDGPTNDARRREFNQAIFAPESEGGWACWVGTDIYMVLEKFDKAVKNLARTKR